jgi:RNA polymerase sigma factor (sigma-70 family)
LDDELTEIRSAKAGDARARERILSAYRPLVNNTARKSFHRVKDRMELEDLVSVGLLALDNAITRFDENKGTRFSYFASMIVRRAIGREVGRSKLQPETIDEEGEEVADIGFEGRRVDKAFWRNTMQECLTARERKAVRLIIWDEMSYRDAAEQMCISEVTVSDVYKTALSKLKEHLVSNGFDAELSAPIEVCPLAGTG